MRLTVDKPCACRRREVWRSAYGADLEVSSCGRVRRPGSRRILRGYTIDGYLYIHHHGRRHRVRVLVLESFVSRRPPGCVARAITNVTNRTDAHAWNLAWGLPGRPDRGWLRRERERRRMARRRGARLPTLHAAERAMAW